jgi:hypothetical protein
MNEIIEQINAAARQFSPNLLGALVVIVLIWFGLALLQTLALCHAASRSIPGPGSSHQTPGSSADGVNTP